MSKVGGLQFSRPAFDWESKDKLTELGQFKADCHVLFSGPLCRSSRGSNSERSGKTKGKFSHKCGKCGHRKVDYIECDHDSDSSSEEIQDLSEQVQSLFYH